MSTTVSRTSRPLEEAARRDSTQAGGRPSAPGGANVQSCAKCGVTTSWGATSWCPECGYYPRLGTTVAVENSAAADRGAQAEGVWALFPGWTRLLVVACLLAIAEVTGVAVYAWPSEHRLTIGAVHLGFGILLVVCAHLRAYFFALTKSDKCSLVDMVVNPLATWRPAMDALPRTQWTLSAAVCGLLISIGGAVMVAQDVDQIFDGAPKRKKKKMSLPVGAVAQAAPASNMSMEEALAELAGTGGAMTSAAAPPKSSGEEIDEPQEPAVQTSAPSRLQTACLIIGFQTDDEGELTALLLAGKQKDEAVRFIGSLPASAIPQGERSSLSNRLRKQLTATAAVECSQEGIWVKPTLRCLVGFDRWNDDGTLQRPVWRALAQSPKAPDKTRTP